MKRYGIILCAVLVLLAACTSQPSVEIRGTVICVDEYGGLQPSFTPADLKASGIAYGDLLTVSIGDDIVVTTPYVDAYTQAGSMSPCLCNYNRADEEATLSMSNGSFAYHVGGRAGDSIVLTLSKRGGYLTEYNLLQGTYTMAREDYSADDVFANFRPLTTTGLRPGVLYRSTSPISFQKNPGRFAYASELCRAYGVQTIVDIADSPEKVRQYLNAEESKDSYMLDLLAQDRIIALGSHADYLDTIYMAKLAYALTSMITKPAPYLIHCNEGKDRTGFYCLLLEALCGAPLDDIRTDYMLTFVNLYHQQPGTKQYDLTWRKNGFRMLYFLAHPECWSDVVSIDWDKATLDGVDIAAAAEQYILRAGLTTDQLALLKARIAL